MTAYVDDDGTSVVDAWDCVPGCPAKDLGDQAEKFCGYNDKATVARYFRQMKGGSEVSTIPDDLIEYLQVLISPPEPTEGARFLGNLEDMNWDLVATWPDNSITGAIVRGTPSEEQSEEIMRVLMPGAHLLLIAPEEQPTGHTGACRLEDTGFEIRDSILLAREAGALHYVPKASRAEREAGCWGLEGKTGAEAVNRKEGSPGSKSAGAGAGRTARKISNFHPTVKPIDVMARLLHDVPNDAVVCDPFMGSGTTGAACAKTGHSFFGIEREEEYIKIADARVRHWRTVFAGQKGRAEVDSDVEGSDDILIYEKPTTKKKESEADSTLMDLFWGDPD